MGNYVKLALAVSRPRFWLYLAGPFLVGYSAGASSNEAFLLPYFSVFFLYFLTIANVYLYGVNDYFDSDTDKFNVKKGTTEPLLKETQRRMLSRILIVCYASSFALFLLLPDFQSRNLFLYFLLLSYLYSAPPLRFKARAIIDFSSNILYAVPGILGYYITAKSIPEPTILIAIFCWTAAMHLFSAIVDIKADSKAYVKTSAVVLGTKKSLALCLIFWSLFSLILIVFSHYNPLAYITVVYPSIPLLLLLNSHIPINKVYWWFPYLNAGLGAIAFFTFYFRLI